VLVEELRHNSCYIDKNRSRVIQGSISENFFSSTKLPFRSWGPPSLLVSGYGEFLGCKRRDVR
jgi:hypothetical protein